ncbi:3-deoxy-7-phosphoheptulonate synthase [Candidatus Vidania fulgoroideorum]
MVKVGCFVRNSRNQVKNIIRGCLNKLIVVIGPCSIHSYRSAVAYCDKLSKLSSRFSNLFLVMRVYLEKPRTTIGWKGLIYDPDINNSYLINNGIRKSIRILKYITNSKLPIATEFLSTFLHCYTSNYITIGSIGARNCESQVHREMSSFLNLPIGFKNDLNCLIDGALNSIVSCNNPSFCFFLGSNRKLKYSVCNTNKNCFLILRGGTFKTNYDFLSVNSCISKMDSMLPVDRGIFIDFSHGNSSKNHIKQFLVSDSVCKQIPTNNRIVGVMIESHINEGSIDPSLGKLYPFISITDPCLSFNDSYRILSKLNVSISLRKPMLFI